MLAAVAAALLRPALPSMLMRVIGFAPIRQSTAPVTAAAVATLANATDGSPISFITEDYGRLALPPGTALETRVGDDALGNRGLRISMRASEMQNFCLQLTAFCGEHGTPIRRAQISVGGGLITISGEASIDLLNLWQAIEIHVAVDNDGALKIHSLTLGAQRFELPDNALGKRILEIEAGIAQITNQLRVESQGEEFRFVGFDLSDNQLVASFR